MTTIKISPDTMTDMSPAEIEEYLVGSGKPEGMNYTLNGEKATWGEGVPDFDTEDDVDPIDYSKLTKEQIETCVIDRHKVNLNTTKLTKAQLIAEAVRLDND